jgi:[ribosomal protein S18]-alanine N-acetyltransferase
MSDQHRIELAELSDARSIESLSREFGEPDLARRWREAVNRAMTSRDANVAVVRDGEELIALGIMEYTDSEAFLPLLAVAPRRQRQGVGNTLLVWLEATAFVAGLRCISVEIRREDSASRCFYRAAGYRREYVDRWTYWKSLDEIRVQGWRRRWAPKR